MVAPIASAESHQSLMLAAPSHINFFTRDKKQIEEMRDHFLTVLADIHAFCDNTGIRIINERPGIGEVTVEGPQESVTRLIQLLRASRLILWRAVTPDLPQPSSPSETILS